MNLTLIIRNWEEGLSSTGEALAQILCSETIVERRLEAIATIALKLQANEQAAAEAADREVFIQTNAFNFTSHVRDWCLRDAPDDDEHDRHCTCEACYHDDEDDLPEYTSEVLDEEFGLTAKGHHNWHVTEFIKHYDF